MPLGDGGINTKHFDKLVHIMMYAGVSFLMLASYWKGDFNRQSISYTFLFSVSYGFLLEILQNTSISQREFDIFDIIANMIGAMAGIIIFKVYKKVFI